MVLVEEKEKTYVEMTEEDMKRMRRSAPLCAPSAESALWGSQEAARFRCGRNVAMAALAMKRQTLVLLSLLSGCGVAEVLWIR